MKKSVGWNAKPIKKWTIVGYYPKLRLPWCTCVGGIETAKEAAEWAISWARKNWPPEQQIIVTQVIPGNVLCYTFGGLLSSAKGGTTKTARLPESAICVKRREQAGRRLERLMRKGLEPLPKSSGEMGPPEGD